MYLFQDKLNPIQSSSDQMSENMSNLNLDNILTADCHSSSAKEKLDKTSQENSFIGKRVYFDLNSVEISKKKKLVPSSPAIDHVSINNMCFI